MDVRTINTIFMRAQGGTPDMWGGNATHFTSYTLTWSSDLSNNGCAHPLRTARTSNRAFQFWKKSKLWYWGSNKGGKKKPSRPFWTSETQWCYIYRYLWLRGRAVELRSQEIYEIWFTYQYSSCYWGNGVSFFCPVDVAFTFPTSDTIQESWHLSKHTHTRYWH